MNKKVSVGITLSFAVILSGITFCISMIISMNYFNTLVHNVNSREDMYQKLSDMDREVRGATPSLIDEQYMLDNIAAGYIKGINDKYATYLSKEGYEQYLYDNSKDIYSIGIEGVIDDSGYLSIVDVYSNTPASQKQLKQGDYIISIDGEDVKGMSQAVALRKLTGQIGTKVTITVRSEGVDTYHEIIRQQYETPTVTITHVGSNAIIKISTIDDNTSKQFTNIMSQAVDAGVSGLIFDVRDARGQSLDSLEAILDTLCPSGSLGRIITNTGSLENFANSDSYSIELPMVVIMNEMTVGYAEHFVATLKDFNLVSTVGTRTYGKTEMQELIPLTDGSAINITTKTLLPPSGNNFSGVGLVPDYEVKYTVEQEQSKQYFDYTNDPQVTKAIEVLNSLR